MQNGAVSDADGGSRLTFAGIGVYRPDLLCHWHESVAPAAGKTPRFKLAPLLRAAMRRSAVHGTHHRGAWTDVGTPERLEQLDRLLAAGKAEPGTDHAAR